MFAMLEIVFGCDIIACCLRIPTQLQIFFRDMLRRATNFDIRPVGLIAAGQGIWPLISAAIAPATPAEPPAQPTPQELLDMVHSFPCEFLIKVIGAAENDFINRVITAIISAEVAETDINYTSRETSGGRHASVSITIIAQSSDHVMSIYAAIRTVEGVVMVM